ncbi:MAG: invasion associated locus B family protein [Paracoccaceae bacterium]
MKISLARALGVAAVMAAGAVSAQESSNNVAVKTDWNVFTEPNPKECWGVSVPKESVNTKDGKSVQVQRSAIQLFVTYRPGKAAEISFTGGYPFAKGSTVAVDIDGSKFEMFTDGEWAWTGGANEDAALLAAMKKGTNAVLTAKSGKGTQTKDTFSLRGFSAAVTEAESRCK